MMLADLSGEDLIVDVEEPGAAPILRRHVLHHHAEALPTAHRQNPQPIDHYYQDPQVAGCITPRRYYTPSLCAESSSTMHRDSTACSVAIMTHIN
jgi:hypothetical protein